jgi:hypothetical protein
MEKATVRRFFSAFIIDYLFYNVVAKIKLYSKKEKF